ncbi:hypothetical protein KVR01_012524 [Diaporthe batatas]|uniref:uncharacterized protein n=1 Tax=Diaporthe batatas TaxID=748121 RepID=UPI001D042722|nr:uncharacterized protein KVR01_012524 [Diaporthe batatas]KAG8157482.1 hypothetical protein KVR01_012524 [Diaporthe batatas]
MAVAVVQVHAVDHEIQGASTIIRQVPGHVEVARRNVAAVGGDMLEPTPTSPATVLPTPGEVLEIILGAGASACQIQEAIPDIPALRPRPHVIASAGGSQIHSGSNLIQPQTKTPSIGNEKYGDRPTINENIGDMTILIVERGGDPRRANNSLAD